MMAGEEATQITREHVGEAGTWPGWRRSTTGYSLLPRKPGQKLTVEKSESTKTFLSQRSFTFPPISHLWPREGLRHSHCRTWILLAESQTVLSVRRAESGRETVCEEVWRRPEERALTLSRGRKPHL